MFVVLAVMPLWLGRFLLTAASLWALHATVGLALPRVASQRVVSGWLVLGVTTVSLWLGPTLETLMLGQVNLILMCLVLLDCLDGRGADLHGRGRP